MKNSELFAGLKPYIVELIRSTSLVAGAGTGSTGTGMQVHALDSSWHTGELDPSQATWALSSYRTVAAGAGLTGGGNLTADITLDVAAGNGIEVTGDAVHVKLKTTSGLLLDASGLSAVTPATLTVATANSLANHTHAITSSANPGAAASLLATDSSGVLQLATLKVGAAATYNSTNDVTAAPDVQFATSGLVAAETSLYWQIDSNDDSTGAIYAWRMNGATSAAGSELMRLTETGRLGIGDSTPSYELDVAGSGQFQTSVLTPTLTTASGALTASPTTDFILTPGSNLVKLSSGIALQSSNFASQATGMRINYAGQADFRYIYTDELHAKAFIADLEQALAGGQIIAKSVTLMYAAFTVPGHGVARDMTVRDLPSALGMAVFEADDCVAVRSFSRAAGSLTIGTAYGIVTGYTDNGDGTQTWTWTRLPLANNAGGAMTTGTVIAAESIVIDYGITGNGWHEVNAIDGAYGANSPYSQIVTWSNTSPGYTGAQTVRTRTGNLNGLFSAGAEWGFYAGDGTATANQFLRISSRAVEMYNVPLRLYASGTQRVNIDAAGTDVWFKNATGDVKLAWNGSTLTVNGDGTFSGTITATAGAIAGWTITSSQIENSTAWIRLISGGAGTARLEVANASYTDRGAGVVSRSTLTGVVFYAGSDFANIANAPFTVTNAGALTATNATLTGSLTAGNVSINSGDAIRITSGATYGEDRSINWYYSTSQIGYINVYGTGVSGAVMTLTASGLLFNSSSIDSTATTIDFGDAAVEVLRIKAATATGYLRSSADGNVLSWSATGVGVTGTLSASGAFTGSSTGAFTGALTAPSYGIASGTAYLKVGSTNVVSWTSTRLNALDKIGTTWTELTVATGTFTGTVTGNVYVKQFGDFIIMKGWIKSTGATGDVIAFNNLPAFMCPGTGVYPFWAQRANNSKIKFEIEGSDRELTLYAYTTSQEIYFDQIMYSVE